ncbi:MAG: cell envelope integrity protein TolA [Arenimonas sp.]
MPNRADQVLATTLALLLHALAFLAFWLGRDWVRDDAVAAAGPVIAATLQFTAADVRAAQAAVAEAKAARPPEEPTPPPPPQPLKTPDPQTSIEPPQVQPQAPLERPDTIDQEAVTRVAPLPSDATEEQRERNRQEQVDLTEEIERQREAENRERLREQYEAIRREREDASRTTRMEEQRLAQLADRQATPRPAPATNTAPPAGSAGTDEGLRARYVAELNATARDNWNTGLAPELVRCRVRFQQIPGGEVINVEFMDCPYDAQGRESVERALRKTPMPYSGFEPVFTSKVTLTFCHPEEACQ